MKKRIMALAMAAVMITAAFIMPIQAEETGTEEPGTVVVSTEEMLGDISADSGTVEPITWDSYNYINQVLGGTGSYWYENHSFLRIHTTDGLTPAVYCTQPSHATPNSSTTYTEYFNTDISTDVGKRTMKYQGIMPYAYSGYASSCNNDSFYNWDEKEDYGGTFGTYIIDNVARQGMMVAGQFYEMSAIEAAAVSAAAIHAISGSNIETIYSKVDSSHSTAVSDCFNMLVKMGNHAYDKAIENNSYWWGLAEGNNASDANTSMTYYMWVKNVASDTWVEIDDISNSQTGVFDWSAYVNNAGNIEYRVRLATRGMETEVIPSSQSGTSGNISYSHTNQIECNFDSSKNGYYDYFKITEGANNTVSNIEVCYEELKNQDVTLTDPTTGGNMTGPEFYQEAQITVDYDELLAGKILDLSIAGNGAYAGRTTTIYGSPELVPVGKTFYANSYQDVVLGSGNSEKSATTSLYAAENIVGDLEITKKSANEDITDGNDCYDLAGAVYCVYSTYPDALNDTNRVASITTDADGKGSVEDLPVGTYYIKEVTPPKGYALDLSIYQTKIESNVAVSMSFTDYPQMDPVWILLRKQGDDGKFLETAEFTIKFYEDVQITTDPALSGHTPDRTWVLKTDIDGYCSLSDEYKISGDDFYYGLTGNSQLPLGTVTIQETKAPKGYILDDTVFVRTITSSGTAESVDTYNAPTITNEIKKQAFQLVKMGETSDGENPLAGAGFMACNVEDLKKDSSGNYIFDESKAVVITKDGKKELFTDEDGYAISCELGYGTYMVRETTVPKNYLAIDDFFVTITEDSDVAQDIRYFTDESFKAFLKIIKKDSDTNENILNNSATFKIWSYAEKKYVSWTVTADTVSYVADTFSTDENGILVTPGYLAPGKYRIEEVGEPLLYANHEFKTDIEISADGVYDAYVDESGHTTDMGVFTVEIENTPIKGQIAVKKLGETKYWDENEGEFKTSSAPLENIEFGIYAKEDILTADGQGEIVFAKDELIETIKTDAEGYAASSKILLSGTYVVKELNTPEEFIKMEDTEVIISSDDEIITDAGEQIYYELLEVTNKPFSPEIHTTARDQATGDNIGKAAEVCTIIDTVYYKNLLLNKKYTIKGILVDKATGEPIIDDGKEVTSEYTFIATSATGNVDMTFTFNSTALEGKSVVVFEDLYLDGKKVATHADIEDEGQTISFPSAPKTGDGTPIVIFIVLLILSAVGIIFLLRKKDEMN